MLTQVKPEITFQEFLTEQNIKTPNQFTEILESSLKKALRIFENTGNSLPVVTDLRNEKRFYIGANGNPEHYQLHDYLPEYFQTNADYSIVGGIRKGLLFESPISNSDFDDLILSGSKGIVEIVIITNNKSDDFYQRILTSNPSISLERAKELYKKLYL